MTQNYLIFRNIMRENVSGDLGLRSTRHTFYKTIKNNLIKIGQNDFESVEWSIIKIVLESYQED